MAPTPDKKAEDLLKRPLYVYDLPHEVLSTLTLKADADNDPEPHDLDTNAPKPSEHAPSGSPQSGSTENVVGSQACSLCGLSFATVEDQRSHQKSDWHHYNLKQKLRGNKPASEIEFEKLVGDLDESLSGSEASESDDDEDDRGSKDSTLTALLKKQATLADRNARANGGNADADEEDGDIAKRRQRDGGKPPLLWFSSPLLPTNSYFGIYRTIFSPEELKDESNMAEIIKKKQLEPIAAPKPKADGSLVSGAYKGPHIFLCMIGGGHFAAMVVSLAPRQSKHGAVGPMNREATVLAHKTFHRYTTRRKQGGSQSANDNAKGNAHSAGSSIRRYNEQALIDEVRLLLQDWKGLLDTCELLFIRATGATNRRTLFGPYEDQVLRANDARIRSFPFSTRRATQNELMRSFIELTRLKVREIDPAQREKPTQNPKAAPVKPAKPAVPKLTEEEETAQLHTSQLQALIRRSKLPALLAYLKSNDLRPDFHFQPVDSQQNHHAPTPLHLTASQNSAPLVSGLLLKAGADPTLRSNEGKTPFDLAGDRATRDAFRVARDELGESAWDWEAAHVPAALRRADADRREERERAEAERKEAERRAAEEVRLRREGPKVGDAKTGGKVRSVLDAGVPRSAQDRREEESRGLTPEQRAKLDRERRARAAEERFRRMQQHQGAGG
ncbi:putative ankyrin repeat and zinc finger domain-containing protein [Rosellinia necatrix]|uniref:Putative ankyrin repeat and zinc finger domain-containing protein n=1 Tax=Rosellinia necatrix TaxID=77044 RepID=A0A1W2TIQ8_ROSNE|nr:putative ankyrin repeat and zinc finger domain-containing protein [Rosellinia necatrix]